jgi:hypothetical protein
MIRDPDLEYRILLAIEAKRSRAPGPIEVDGADSQDVLDHLALMYEEGLYSGPKPHHKSSSTGEVDLAPVGDLTPAGRRRLEELRDEHERSLNEPPEQTSEAVSPRGVQAGGIAGDITASIQNRPSEASFELLVARVALLEAAISAPKPVGESPIGIGHNRGPDLVLNPALDEAEIQEIIALLRQQSATTPVDRPKLVEIAKSIEPEHNKWRERLDEFTLGVIKGSGEEIGKRLIQAPWWMAVYSQLEAVGHALVVWLSTLPPV